MYQSDNKKKDKDEQRPIIERDPEVCPRPLSSSNEKLSICPSEETSFYDSINSETKNFELLSKAPMDYKADYINLLLKRTILYIICGMPAIISLLNAYICGHDVVEGEAGRDLLSSMGLPAALIDFLQQNLPLSLIFALSDGLANFILTAYVTGNFFLEIKSFLWFLFRDSWRIPFHWCFAFFLFLSALGDITGAREGGSSITLACLLGLLNSFLALDLHKPWSEVLFLAPETRELSKKISDAVKEMQNNEFVLVHNDDENEEQNTVLFMQVQKEYLEKAQKNGREAYTRAILELAKKLKIPLEIETSEKSIVAKIMQYILNGLGVAGASFIYFNLNEVMKKLFAWMPYATFFSPVIAAGPMLIKIAVFLSAMAALNNLLMHLSDSIKKFSRYAWYIKIILPLIFIANGFFLLSGICSANSANYAWKKWLPWLTRFFAVIRGFFVNSSFITAGLINVLLGTVQVSLDVFKMVLNAVSIFINGKLHPDFPLELKSNILANAIDPFRFDNHIIQEAFGKPKEKSFFAQITDFFSWLLKYLVYNQNSVEPQEEWNDNEKVAIVEEIIPMNESSNEKVAIVEEIISVNESSQRDTSVSEESFFSRSFTAIAHFFDAKVCSSSPFSPFFFCQNGGNSCSFSNVTSDHRRGW